MNTNETLPSVSVYESEYSLVLNLYIIPSIWTPIPQDAPIYPYLMSTQTINNLEKMRQLEKKRQECLQEQELLRLKQEEIIKKKKMTFREKNINTQFVLLQTSYPDKTICYEDNNDGTISFFGYNYKEYIFLGKYSF